MRVLMGDECEATGKEMHPLSASMKFWSSPSKDDQGHTLSQDPMKNMRGFFYGNPDPTEMKNEYKHKF